MVCFYREGEICPLLCTASASSEWCVDCHTSSIATAPSFSLCKEITLECLHKCSGLILMCLILRLMLSRVITAQEHSSVWRSSVLSVLSVAFIWDVISWNPSFCLILWKCFSNVPGFSLPPNHVPRFQSELTTGVSFGSTRVKASFGKLVCECSMLSVVWSALTHLYCSFAQMTLHRLACGHKGGWEGSSTLASFAYQNLQQCTVCSIVAIVQGIFGKQILGGPWWQNTIWFSMKELAFGNSLSFIPATEDGFSSN